MPSKQYRGKRVFIVQGKPREPEGIVKITKATRKEALETANDFLRQGLPFVTIVADGRLYTAEEFAITLLDPEQKRAEASAPTSTGNSEQC
jgi:hypothetical protein